ncbi:hypothetical protein ACWXZL_34180, partial [Pseudomonas aeruginosa]
EELDEALDQVLVVRGGADFSSHEFLVSEYLLDGLAVLVQPDDVMVAALAGPHVGRHLVGVLNSMEVDRVGD